MKRGKKPLHPTPCLQLYQKGSVTISQEFLFWKCNQAWVQICSQVYSCQEGGTLTLKPTPVNHAGQLCWLEHNKGCWEVWRVRRSSKIRFLKGWRRGRRMGRAERWDFWCLLEALRDENSAACCFVLAHHRLFDLLACVYDVVSLSASVNLYYWILRSSLCCFDTLVAPVSHKNIHAQDLDSHTHTLSPAYWRNHFSNVHTDTHSFKFSTIPAGGAHQLGLMGEKIFELWQACSIRCAVWR